MIKKQINIPARTLQEQRALTEKEAAQYTRMSVSYLRQSRMSGIRDKHIVGPSWIKLGKSVRYLQDDLDTWLELHRVQKFGGHNEHG